MAMRAFLFLALLFSGRAFAELSIIEFTFPRLVGIVSEQRYQIILHGESNQLDEIHRLALDGTWKRVFVGPITFVTLPEGGKVTKFYGPRAMTDVRIRFGDYDLTGADSDAGVRVRSDQNLVLLLPFEATIVPWPGQIKEVVPVESGYDFDTGQSFFIFSVSGHDSANTYIILNDHYKYPIPIADGFRREKFDARIENGWVHIPSLNKAFDLTQKMDGGWPKLPVPFHTINSASAEAYEKLARRTFGNGLIDRLFIRHESKPQTAVTIRSEERLAFLRELIRPPSANEVMDELIALLDDREPLESMENAEVLVRRAIRGMLFRQFPPLRELERSDAVVKQDIDKLLQALTYLWFERKAVNGELIRNTFIQRLEAAVEKRTKCELSLLKFEGPGSHAAGYFRLEAMGRLNAIYRKLYK